MKVPRITFWLPSVLLLSIVGNCFGDGWGSLSGTFVLGGKIPAPVKIKIDKDVEVCSKGKLVDESLIVDAKTRGIADIMVYIHTKPGESLPKIHPDYSKTANDKVKLDNTLCRFEPRVVLLRTSQSLVIGNTDPVGHNANAAFTKNIAFNVTIPAGGSITKALPNAEPRPATVTCGIHPYMKSFVLLKDHPYMAKTDKQGKFKIKKIPGGEWTFQFRHDKYIGSKAGQITIAKGDAKPVPAKWSKGREKFKIEDGKETKIGTVTVDVSAF